MAAGLLLQPSPPSPSIKKPILIRTTYFLIIPFALLNIFIFSSPPSIPPPVHKTRSARGRRCDFADGRWVPDPRGPAYNDSSCSTIKSGQNCAAHGRPDAGYLHWRWIPEACRLPVFSAAAFLRLLADKHLAFVGDSLARNQLESLLCLLSAAAGPPELIYRRGEEEKFRRWVFRSHNATVSVYWSPFLVKGVEKSLPEGRTHNQVYLDTADERWAADLAGIDAVVFSAGHWFLLPGVFYSGGGGGEVFGCHHCSELNLTETGFFPAFGRAVRTALGTAAGKMGRGKMAVVATFSPAHFEGEWDKAGACGRKEPFREGEKEMEYMDREMRRIAVEEAAAATSGGLTGARVEVLDVTRMAMMRPDGHPGPYMHAAPFAGGVKERVQNDCVHWCLPGPIDAWNEILLVLMGMWREGEMATSYNNPMIG